MNDSYSSKYNILSNSNTGLILKEEENEFSLNEINDNSDIKLNDNDNNNIQDSIDDEDLIFNIENNVNDGSIPPNGFKGVLFYLSLSSYWLATSAVMGGLQSVVLPNQIAKIGGEDNKEKYSGLLPILGVITSVIIGPVSGYLSDHCTNRFGKRRIFIVIGTLVALVSLFLTGSTNNIYAFMLFLMGVQFGIGLGQNPFNGLLPDLIPKEKYGIASGYLAFSNAIGQLIGIIGTALCIKFTNGSYVITYSFLIVILLIASLPTILFIKEKPQSPIHVPKITLKRFIHSFYLPKDIYSNFYWVIITRFMQVLGVSSILPFFSFYLSDIIHIDIKDRATYTSIVLSLIILTSVPSGMIGGPLSQKYGRKLLVYISCGIMTCCVCGFILLSFIPSFKLVMVFSVIFGLGYGSYQGVDYALALDVLPPECVAKDLAIWHQALVIPQIFAPAISGFIINSLKNNSLVLGYTVAFGLAAVWFLLSTILIKPINLNSNNNNTNKFIKLKPTSIDL